MQSIGAELKSAAEMSRVPTRNAKAKPTKLSQIGIRSPRHRLRRLDRRTKEGRFIAETELALIEHLGGPTVITAPQRFLVERLAADMLRIELFEDKIIAGEPCSDLGGRIYNALRNSVRLGLKQLGLEPKAAASTHRTIYEYIDADGPGA